MSGGSGRRLNDPNMPPSYDQAVSGRDRSVKVAEGVAGVKAGAVPPPEYSPLTATIENDNDNDVSPLLP